MHRDLFYGKFYVHFKSCNDNTLLEHELPHAIQILNQKSRQVGKMSYYFIQFSVDLYAQHPPLQCCRVAGVTRPPCVSLVQGSALGLALRLLLLLLLLPLLSLHLHLL